MGLSAPLGTRLVVLISQQAGITPKRMAFLLKATTPSVWRCLRQLRSQGVISYDKKEHTWRVLPQPEPVEINFSFFQGPS